MVSNLSIFAISVGILISFGIPLGVLVYLIVKYKGENAIYPFVFGCLGFFIFQVIIRIPLVGMFNLSPGASEFISNQYVMYIFMVALTAAIVELIPRYIGSKIMRKRGDKFLNGFALGMGHGGIEAMILIGINYISYIMYALIINAGNFDNMISDAKAQGLDVTAYSTLRDTLVDTKSIMFFLAGYERIVTMIIQVALTLLVMYYVVKKKDFVGIVLCIFAHTMIDFTTVLISGLSTRYLGKVLNETLTVVLTYVFLTVIAAAAVYFIIRVKKELDEETKKGKLEEQKESEKKYLV